MWELDHVRRLSTEELMLCNCGAGEDSWDPWTARRSNQSILKEINLEYSLEGQMLKQKLQYLGHLMGRADSLENTLMLGKIEGKRRRGRQRMRWLYSITNSMNMNLSILQERWRTEKPGVLQFIESQRVKLYLVNKQQQHAVKSSTTVLYLQPVQIDIHQQLFLGTSQFLFYCIALLKLIQSAGNN